MVVVVVVVVQLLQLVTASAERCTEEPWSSNSEALKVCCQQEAISRLLCSWSGPLCKRTVSKVETCSSSTAHTPHMWCNRQAVVVVVGGGGGAAGRKGARKVSGAYEVTHQHCCGFPSVLHHNVAFNLKAASAEWAEASTLILSEDLADSLSSRLAGHLGSSRADSAVWSSALCHAGHAARWQ